MSDKPFEETEARALWRRVSGAAEPVPEEISAEDASLLAAWLEGRLDGGAHEAHGAHEVFEAHGAFEAFEARLAASPALRQALAALDAEAPPAPVAAPAAVLDRAKGLVAPDRTKPARGGLLSRLHPDSLFGGLVEWGAAAALLVLVSVAGFDMGSAAADIALQAEEPATTDVALDIDDGPLGGFDALDDDLAAEESS